MHHAGQVSGHGFSLAYTPVGQFQVGDVSEMIGVVADQGQVVRKGAGRWDLKAP